MPTLKGDAGFKYDPGTGTVTLALQYPLWRAGPGRFKWRRKRWSADGTVAETLVIGSGLNEIRARLRFANNPTAILDFLESAADGVALQYFPSLAVSGTFIPCVLVEPDGNRHDLEIELDRLGNGEYAIDVRLRRTDGGDWSALPGSNL